MNHPDRIAINAGHYQSDLSQRLTAAIVTILLAGLLFYGFPYLARETTIKRKMYEFSTTLLPTRFINSVQKAATSLAGRSGILPQLALSERRDGTSEASGVLSVVQRARTLSGFDKLVTGTQEPSFSGLGNWDNSCYQNSVLQGLTSLPAFKAFVEKSCDMLANQELQAETIEALQIFTDQLLEDISGRRTLWPPPVLKSMNTWQQQDAQEYFSKIMDAIDKESAKYCQRMARRLAPGLNSLQIQDRESPSSEHKLPQYKHTVNRLSVEATFPRNPLDGTLSQILRCQTCGFSEGLSIMSFNCLTLNLGLGGNCFLEDLLDAYTDPELIEGVECEECTRIAQKEKREPQLPTAEVGLLAEPEPHTTARMTPKVLSTKAKQILFGRLPQDLIIHINRSIFDDWGNQRKNTSLIGFPPLLEIVDDWVTPLGLISPRQHGSYELKCTVTHSGRHDNGHYVAYGKRGKDWYCFNDEVVTKMSEEQVLNRGNVFLLFYELTVHEAAIEADIAQNSDSDDTHEIGVASTDTQQHEDNPVIQEAGAKLTNTVNPDSLGASEHTSKL